MRVAISPCPNDIFVFGPLILGRVPWEGEPLKFEFLDIEALNLRGEEDEAPDVLKCSFARFAELGHAYELCPVGAALGRWWSDAPARHSPSAAPCCCPDRTPRPHCYGGATAQFSRSALCVTTASRRKRRRTPRWSAC